MSIELLELCDLKQVTFSLMFLFGFFLWCVLWVLFSGFFLLLLLGARHSSEFLYSSVVYFRLRLDNCVECIQKCLRTLSCFHKNNRSVQAAPQTFRVSISGFHLGDVYNLWRQVRWEYYLVVSLWISTPNLINKVILSIIQ